jgi:hypothetical protein
MLARIDLSLSKNTSSDSTVQNLALKKASPVICCYSSRNLSRKRCWKGTSIVKKIVLFVVVSNATIAQTVKLTLTSLCLFLLYL